MFERRVAWTSRDLALWLLSKFGGGWTLGDVKKARFSPRTVVDVGADRGTPQLYDAFPEAYHFLVEPLTEYESNLRKALEPYQGEYIYRRGRHQYQGVHQRRTAADDDSFLAAPTSPLPASKMRNGRLR